MGYEAYREIVLENQKKLGIVPPDTELSPVNPYLDVKGPNGEAVAATRTPCGRGTRSTTRRSGCSAGWPRCSPGFLSYTDAQIGRVLDYLEESGQLDNTIIVIISDNGASGEGGPNGSVNENKFFNGYIDTVEESMRFYDQLGGPETYNHYPIGWAMAFNTPYKLFKRYASHEGGIADTAIISWPKGIKAHGEVRDNYVNVCDVTPTIYDLLGITPPDEVAGIAQKPLDGVSFKAALDDSTADTGKDTQFYTMLGTRGIWHDGWFANTVHAASPAGWSHFDDDRWELFHIESDRSQCHDLAAEQPEKLEELKALWFAEAAKYNGLPLGDLNIFETLGRFRPYLSVDRKNFTYYPDTAEVGIGAAVELRGQSFSVLAEVTVDTTGAEGVLFKQGAGHGGHVLFVQDGRLHYVYNFMGEDEQRVSAPDPIPLGSHVFGVRYERTGTVEGSHTPLGDVSLYVDGDVVATRTGRAGPSRQLRPGRRRRRRRPQRRPGRCRALQGAVRVHRRHHRQGGRRHLGHALRGRRARTRAGIREGLMNLMAIDLTIALACVVGWRRAACAQHDRGRCRSPQRRPPAPATGTVDADAASFDAADAPTDAARAFGVVPTTRVPIAARHGDLRTARHEPGTDRSVGQGRRPAGARRHGRACPTGWTSTPRER